jgi:hypothetical protein
MHSTANPEKRTGYQEATSRHGHQGNRMNTFIMIRERLLLRFSPDKDDANNRATLQRRNERELRIFAMTRFRFVFAFIVLMVTQSALATDVVFREPFTLQFPVDVDLIRIRDHLTINNYIHR